MKRLSLLAALSLAALPVPALADACRVTDFTQVPLSSLNAVQQWSFVVQMTQTEYDRLRTHPADHDDFIRLLAESSSLRAARDAAHTLLKALQIENIDDYPRVWASDFLTDEEMRAFADCESSRRPGLRAFGRSESPDMFHLTYVHLTPIGIEAITTRVVASRNVANIAEFEAELAALGPQDNYPARTFSVRLENPQEPGVLVLRAGWETPLFVFIPPYPTDEFLAAEAARQAEGPLVAPARGH